MAKRRKTKGTKSARKRKKTVRKRKRVVTRKRKKTVRKRKRVVTRKRKKTVRKRKRIVTRKRKKTVRKRKKAVQKPRSFKGDAARAMAHARTLYKNMTPGRAAWSRALKNGWELVRGGKGGSMNLEFVDEPRIYQDYV